jgi:tripartite-type tricarboxylate transporter receptor subunit TctC
MLGSVKNNRVETPMRARIAALVTIGLLAASGAQAQSWPSRPVTVVVPFAAGVTGDIVARGLVEHLSSALGQPFVVDNRSGAGGNIGGAAVAKAAPDGYTLLLSTTGPASSNKLTYKNMPYDPQRDLAPIVLMGKAPVIIVAKNSLPAKTLKEFVDYAKTNPGKITAGYPGNGTQGHITGELLQQRAGMSFVQTQYRGSPAIITDILGEHIDIGMDSMAPYVPLIQEKKLRGLAIAGAKRWPLLPDVPTVAESGFPGFEAAVWYALLAPTGTSPEIVAKLNEAANAYLKTKAAAELFEKLGIQPNGGTPQELKVFIEAELERWGPIIKAAKIEF